LWNKTTVWEFIRVKRACLPKTLKIYSERNKRGDHAFIPQTMSLFIPLTEYIYSQTGK
jgi:hypothetical protein